ncbi:DUF7529 family protein [Halobaculum sp. P14]|uniref:DUF7529 family protein n=1 Tax=Halobaculum sp. P14 TaxID=3421638 RepID=UPI003EBA197C
MAGSHPLAGVEDFWQDVMDDMEATAEEYRDAGWDVLALHPGDVTALPTASAQATPDRVGLDVLLPGDEFEELEGLVAETDAEFDEYDAYRAETDDVVFLVVAMKSESAGAAVVFPLYYAVSEAAPMLKQVARIGELRTYLRPLDDSSRVLFTQQEPSNLLPEEFTADADDGGESDADGGDGGTDDSGDA